MKKIILGLLVSLAATVGFAQTATNTTSSQLNEGTYVSHCHGGHSGHGGYGGGYGR